MLSALKRSLLTAFDTVIQTGQPRNDGRPGNKGLQANGMSAPGGARLEMLILAAATKRARTTQPGRLVFSYIGNALKAKNDTFQSLDET
jgi:hypothetical protein